MTRGGLESNSGSLSGLLLVPALDRFEQQARSSIDALGALGITDTIGCFLDEMYPEGFNEHRFRLAQLETAAKKASRPLGHARYLYTESSQSKVPIARMDDGLRYFTRDLRSSDAIRFNFWELKSSGLLFLAERLWEEAETRNTNQAPFLTPSTLLHHIAGGVDLLIRLYTELAVPETENLTYRVQITGTQGRIFKEPSSHYMRRASIAHAETLTWTRIATLKDWATNRTAIAVDALQHFHERFDLPASDDSVRSQLEALWADSD